MAYNISTMHIWRLFNGDCVCPMCKLKTKTEGEIAEMYLSEAVMEDAERAKVNKYGFCKDHFDLLYTGKNKLGVALQTSTRLNTVNKLIKPTDPKSCAKYAKKLREEFIDCIICRTLEFNMKRYFETVARLYGDDEKFRRQFETVKGFCYPDYIRLVENAPKAGKYAKQFLEVLYSKQKSQAETLSKDLNDFTMAFDYRSGGLPPKSAQLSLIKSRIIFYGEKPTIPERK
ncbi:MAG: hypothetical protein IKL82_01515 [Clostridia bacterium]|nr:hypothetical protein [Clostridia bacterium]